MKAIIRFIAKQYRPGGNFVLGLLFICIFWAAVFPFVACVFMWLMYVLPFPPAAR
ncbi:hypothetical protein BM43_3178 [Burkholderia gladioli]|uniref:hypothetical protein n=1 Tax=Burkholderia gladioli TaxID=28095 RepID=UPI0005D9278E|nr:hypothetical protein [Burkholderia gladioli]AJW99216.1 hypothetical protein BM43_3178 [Burkholderia gladioli]SPV21797.1 Uncharacterised protein [Burkholderia gladioli]